MELETDLYPISVGKKTLPELLERKNIPTIDQEQDMGIAKNDGNLEAAEQSIDV